MHSSLCEKTPPLVWKIPNTTNRIVADEAFIKEFFPQAIKLEESPIPPPEYASEWKNFEGLLKQVLYTTLIIKGGILS